MVEETSLLEASYARVFGRGATMNAQAEAFFDDFYRRFCAHEDVAARFADTDMAKQITMLRKSFYHLISFAAVDAPPGHELLRLAERHQHLGIEPSLYNRWVDSLIDTLAEWDPEFDTATALAWRAALAPGITIMKWSQSLRNSAAASPAQERDGDG
jgi:truncated hemoglobin YjbI